MGVNYRNAFEAFRDGGFDPTLGDKAMSGMDREPAKLLDEAAARIAADGVAAAKKIKTLIDASVERVSEGTALVDEAGSTMAEIVSSLQCVTDIMGEISAASSQQSSGVSQVGDAVSQMDQVRQQNAALVEESAAAAAGLQSQSRQLVRAVAVFRLG